MGVHIKSSADIERLRIKIFADGADASGMRALCALPLLKGFTTNPSMMHSAGVSDYETFAREVLGAIGHRPVSFEVISDDDAEMERQARKIAAWGENVYVKIPITNTKAEPTKNLVRRLAGEGIKLNITALMTLPQVAEARDALEPAVPAYISVFAGRIADTGRDPAPVIEQAVEMLQEHPKFELIWASARETLNLFQADRAGCHIITLTNELIKKLPLVGKDLDEYSLDTVKMFHRDAGGANLKL